ncbi:GMC oxidoreductase [Psychromarinibacter sp. C21-152]|uniref:GMC oxidoreductase n=1 Tax=Psychromarinibacter sediminicola TaxID=3033385 RepID=A0AAE3NNB4_9RHOB|nr:GMC oxidoreductase [Psychromarinibacter sediminicola]MDF0599464.1 GMC oxidoreductase [Psychromarinibacter sediminicola]
MTDGALLRRVIDAIAPDPRIGALAAGAHRYVAERLDRDPAAGEVRAGLDTLAGDAAQADLAARLADVEDTPWFRHLCRWVAEGLYADPGQGGNRGGMVWDALGYRHGLPEGPDGPPWRTPPPAQRPPADEGWDAVVVGAGAGGIVAATEMAERGFRVLLVEKGRHLSYRDSGRRDHLRNHRNAVYGTNTGPPAERDRRVAADGDGAAALVRPHEAGYADNAPCVGAGTFLYGGLAWRFHPDDFRMASRYGVPEGSSLADWPVDYDTLEPWYGRIEQAVGIAGPRGALPHEPYRSTDLPLPPVPRYRSARVLDAGAAALGIETFTPPLAVNTRRRDGRAACIECGSCVGFPCPVDAKNGTQNTLLPKALATGNLTLCTETTAERVETDDTGRVTGVRLAWLDDGALHRRTVASGIVVLCAGAIETARLLLLSASSREPDGLGNGTDLVGRNLQGHTYPLAFGRFEEDVATSRGPGPSIATTAWVHGNPGIIGGAMLADDFVMPPVMFWDTALPDDLPRWGAPPHRFMAECYRKVAHLRGPVQEIPTPVCRVTLEHAYRDHLGRPVARLQGVVHPETQRTAAFVCERAKDWLRAAGAGDVWGSPQAPRLSAHQHQAGTCRFGTDPQSSVADPYGRVWDHENLFVADGSLHPTNGAFNPVLTIMALALRTADHIARRFDGGMRVRDA